MATLKELKERENYTNEWLIKAENVLKCKFDYFNNIKKVYVFRFGERLHYGNIELSKQALEYIGS